MANDTLEVAFDGEIWFWRGPAPFCFVTVPGDGRYVVPVKAAVRRAEGLAEGDSVRTELSIPP